MKTKAQKQQEVEFLKEQFEKNPVVVMCSFRGIKVDEDFQLRKTVRATGASYRVVTNRLARLAAAGTPLGDALNKITGMTSIVMADDDPVGLMKALIDYSKDNPVFSFKAGVVDGQELDPNGLERLSKMPGKQETQAKLLFMLKAPAENLVKQVNAPAQNLVGILNAPARDLVSVLKQAHDQGKFNG